MLRLRRRRRAAEGRAPSGVGGLGRDGAWPRGLAEAFGPAETSGGLDDRMDRRVAADVGGLAAVRHEAEVEGAVSDGPADAGGHVRGIAVRRIRRKGRGILSLDGPVGTPRSFGGRPASSDRRKS
jgi:hypothetical protein